MKRIKCLVVVMALFALMILPSQKSYAANVKLSKKNISLYENETTILKVKNTTKAVKWKTNSKNISLEPGKYSVAIQALHPGKAVVTATIEKKKLRCVVKVQKISFKKQASKECIYNGQTNCIEWSAIPSADGYIIEKKDDTGKYKLLAKVEDGSKRSFEDDSNKDKKIPSYRIRAYKTVNGKTMYSKWTVQKDILE